VDGGKKHVASFGQSQASMDYTRQMGTVACLMLRCRNYRFFATACLGAWIHPPVTLGQIRLFFDNMGEPVGYITWALLAPDVESRIATDPKFLLHASEWNEGDRLWIIDFVAPGGLGRQLQDFVEQDMFEGFSEARYVRRNPNGSVRKVIVRRRKAMRLGEGIQ
jgi:cytolysin-activating lysine-acyltransferase